MSDKTFNASIILGWLDGCSFDEFEDDTNESNLECIQEAGGDVEDIAKEFPSQTLAVINKWIADERKEYDSPEATAEREEEEKRYQRMWRSEIAHQAGMMGGIQAYNDHMY